MADERTGLEQRIESLERRLRRSQLGLAALAVTAGTLALVAAAAPVMPADGILRARGIVITDAKGVERIHIGSPVPDPPGETGHRIHPATGMIIHDENGRERFGVGLMPTGQMTMGFDAAPVAGNSANRERLHLGVMPDGTSFIRLLNQRSGPAGRIQLTDDDRMTIEFWDQKDRVSRRSIIDGEGWRRLPDFPLPPQAWKK